MQAKNLYSILKWADSNQISMDLTLENNEDSISFLWPFPNFQGHSNIGQIWAFVVGREHLFSLK